MTIHEDLRILRSEPPFGLSAREHCAASVMWQGVLFPASTGDMASDAASALHGASLVSEGDASLWFAYLSEAASQVALARDLGRTAP